jgi:hypothetical protein
MVCSQIVALGAIRMDLCTLFYCVARPVCPLTVSPSTHGLFNRTPAIRNLPLRVTPIFANKNHALNTLKMGPFVRINVMLPQGVSG